MGRFVKFRARNPRAEPASQQPDARLAAAGRPPRSSRTPPSQQPDAPPRNERKAPYREAALSAAVSVTSGRAVSTCGDLTSTPSRLSTSPRVRRVPRKGSRSS